MARADIRLFLESDEYGLEEFSAETWKEAISTLKDLFSDATDATRNDGIERRIGFIIPGDKGGERDDAADS